MEAYGDVVSAILKIMQGVDRRDRALFADGWTRDVDFEVTFFAGEPVRVSGRDQLVARFTADWTGEPSALRHQVGAVSVEMHGPGEAHARFYCTYYLTGAAVSLAGMGEYEDVVVREDDGRWRVRRRRHRFLTPLAH